MIDWGNIVRELIAHRKSLTLTVIAVAWGTLSITSMLAIGEGLRLTFGHAMQSSGKNLIIVQPGQTSKAFQGQPKNRVITLNTNDINKLKKAAPDIASMTVVNRFVANIYYKNKTTWAGPYAVLPIYSQLRNIQVNPPGRFINNIDMLDFSRVVVLGNKVASALFHHINPLGEIIKLGGKPFTVIGVMRPKIQFGTLGGYPDSMQVWIPLSTYQSLTGDPNYNALWILPVTGHTPKQTTSQIRTAIADIKHFNPDDLQALQISDLGQIQKNTNAVFFGMQIFLGLIGVLTLIVAGIGIGNVMFFSVRQARRDIGVKMAIGARGYHIICHYIFEALLITLIGGLIGIILTFILIYIFNLIPIHAQFYQILGKPKPILSWGVFLSVVVVLGVVGIVSGFFPARKAARINPIEALRND